jgi:menaquinone-dependent protoporphyrinogen oxidase
MNVLIATASRHGSTREIGDALAAILREAGNTVVVCTTADVEHVTGYDAVVIGSAVYMGSWLPEARAFVGRNSAALKRTPVWLFSSGPIGPATSPINQKQLDELMQLSGCREHHVFAGKLDADHLGFGERLAVRLVRAPGGDFRDWEEVKAWAEEISAQLRRSPVTAT